jgi:hypothetical protein
MDGIAESAYQALQNLNNVSAAAAKEDTYGTTSSDSSTKKTTTSSKTNTTSTSVTKSVTDTSKNTTDNSSKAEGVAAAIWLSANSKWGSGTTRAKRLKEKGVTKAQDILNDSAKRNALSSKWSGKDLSKYYYGAFDTGGYTGEWGNEGKLAVLHQKELVLNKEDTENMLSAVKIVRSLDDVLNSINQSITARIGGLLSDLGSSIVGSFSSSSDKLEQDVHIEATFPNVTSSTEIEDALNNLVNIASQKANPR